jgi:hypothetical protein
MLYRIRFPFRGGVSRPLIRLECAFRSSSACVPAVRPVNACRAVLPSVISQSGRPYARNSQLSPFRSINRGSDVLSFSLPGAGLLDRIDSWGRARPRGARVAQASVVVGNWATSTRYSTSTDGEGHFTIELLPPGITPSASKPMQCLRKSPHNCTWILEEPPISHSA